MSKCYFYIDELVSWYEAIEMCAAHDQDDGVATLTSVRSQEENDFVFYSLVPVGYAPWIGGTDEAEERTWR